MKQLLLLVLAAALSPSALIAAEVPEPLKKCAQEENDTKRLACFDAWLAAESTNEVSKAPETATAKRAEPASEAPTVSPPVAEVDAFGMNEKIDKDKPAEPDSITAVVTRIEEKTRGERVIHLDIGQAWEEQGASRNVLLEVGDKVVIEKGMFGSYKLSPAGSNRLIRVTRVK